MICNLLLNFSSVPVEIRISIILALLLSITAVFLSGAAVFLFYKFYRDTIKPIPQIQFESSGMVVSLKLVNNGHSPFYVNKVMVMRNNRITDNILDFLPLFGKEGYYISFATSLEGRRVMPDQALKIFEIDKAIFIAESTKKDLIELLEVINEITVEIHCFDIGKRYKSVVRSDLQFNDQMIDRQT